MLGTPDWFLQTLACLKTSSGSHFWLILMKVLVIMNNLMANKNFILYLFGTGGILSIIFCYVDIIRRIKRCRPAIEVFLGHRYTSDKKMVENSSPQTEWAA